MLDFLDLDTSIAPLSRYKVLTHVNLQYAVSVLLHNFAFIQV